MSLDERAVYVLQEDETEEWVRPTRASTAIVEAVTDRTDLEEGDIDDLSTYVDWEELASLLEGGEAGELSFTVEGYEVTVDAGGTVTVAG